MFKFSFSLIYFVIIENSLICLAWIYNQPAHSPCNNNYRGINGYCVPVRQCCSHFDYSEDQYEYGNCPDEKLCCSDNVLCQDCLNGYQEENQTCVDIDECKSWGVCSGHKCINTKGSYECECDDSFDLIGTEKICRFKNQSETGEMMFSQTFRISLLQFNESNADNENTDLLYGATISPKSIDYSFRGNYMAWTDIFTKQINMGPISFQNPSYVMDRVVFKSDKQPYLLSVDWIHDLIYWTDLGSRDIHVMSIYRPNDYYTVVNTQTLISDFKVNVLDNCLVWTYVGSKPRIMRSLQDGTQHNVLYTPTLQPYYIAIDVFLKRYFVLSIDSQNLWSINFNGQDEKQSFHWPGVFYNVINSPVLYGDIIYFLKESSIVTYDKFGKKSGWQYDNRDKVSRNYDFKIIDPLLQPKTNNKCFKSKCSHICIPSDQQKVFRCLCPNNYILINDSICFEKQLENLLIDAINREKSWQYLINHVINKSIDLNDVNYISGDDDNDGHNVILVLILIVLFFLLAILILIGFKLNVFNIKLKSERSIQKNNPLYNSDDESIEVMESKT